MGWDSPFTDPISTMTSLTFSMLGNSNIVFNKTFSRIDLNPLAPVFLFIAFKATSFIALSLNVNFVPSSLNNSWYCFINEFFGS